MAGLYVHIPFCKRRCIYCDFFSTTLLHRRKEYVEALVKEINWRKDEANEPIRTIYIGGGTPSVLDLSDIEKILKAIGTEDKEEITMELNPGDASFEYLQGLRQIGIQRLSMGIQSFQDELLQFLGRRHNAQQATQAVQMAQSVGFDNLSTDLMYALPNQTMEQWKADIETAIDLGVQHISSYGLMYEEGTALTAMRDNKQIEPIDEDTENEMYDYLCERLKQAGFVHYEVSNFALPRYEAKHNSNYWNHTPYVGVGAGAHSYIGNIRSWNPDDLDVYINGIMACDLCDDKQKELLTSLRENEKLTKRDIYNEQIMLGLRTNRGILEPISNQSRANYERLEKLIQAGLLCKTTEGRIIATQNGLHVLNQIIEQLMIED